MMTGADVVVATAGLDDDTVRQIATACDRLSARYVPGPAGEPAFAGPAGVVAGLPAGQRRVPPALMRLCTETRPGTPLLLLCHEGLVSPTVALHGGQIVLVAPPFSAARLQGRLAVLHAEHVGDAEAPSVVTAVDEPGLAVSTRERLHDDVWLAGVTCRGPGADVGIAPVLINSADGATALLPVRPGRVVADHERQAVLDAFASDLSSERRLRQARTAVDQVGVIHLDRRREEWLIAWPWSVLPLWLQASQRLPPLWNLGARIAARGERVLRAAAGDLVVGLTGLPEGDADDLATHGYDAVIRRGGHALLAAFERRLTSAPRALGGVLIEVRG